MISAAQLTILLRLLIAHLLADFFLQRYQWVVNKRSIVLKYRYIFFHVIIVGLLTYLLLMDWSQWQVPVFIVVTHFLIDLWKSNQKDSTAYFLIDQLLHIIMLILAWLWYIGFDGSSFLSWIHQTNAVAFWVILAGYLMLLRPVGFFIGKATRSWQKELEPQPASLKGLTNAGTWIGYLERLIILTLFLMSQIGAIGFLIAAKSIFRFNGKSEDIKSRKHAEYILIGTLMSFFMAIITGIAVRYLLAF